MNTGTGSGYQSTFTVEAMLQMVIQNMTVDNPYATVAAGRIDVTREKEFDRLDYSLEEG